MARLWAVTGLLLAIALGFIRLGPAAKNDPDRYFNLRLASMVAEQGIVRQLPQFPDLGWDKTFPEKEFLYHQLLGEAYRLGGEKLAEAFAPFIAAALILTVFVFLSGRMPVSAAAFGCLLLWVVNPVHFSRMVALRSYVWASLLFFLFLWSLERRKAFAAGIAAAALALSYHAFYVVALPLVALAFFDRTDRKVGRCLLAAASGIVAGILVNPHFPDSLWIVWLSLELGSRAARLASLTHGAEVAGLGFGWKLACYSFPIFLTLSAVFLGFKNSSLRARAMVCAGFLLLSFATFRGTEYLVPAASLVLPAVWTNLAGSFRWRAGLGGVLLVSGACAVPLWTHEPGHDERREVVASLAGRIPSGAKVVNGDWAIGAEVFYHRPDLKLVDALDSTMLAMESPELNLLRESLHRGEALDWAKVFREKFRAEWLLTRSSATIERLEKIPKVQIVKTYAYRNASGAQEVLSLIRFATGHSERL